MTEKEYLRHLEAIGKRLFGPADALPRSRNETLKLAKRFLKLKATRIKQRHRAGVDGAEVCRMHSDVVDLLSRQLWRECLAHLPAGKDHPARAVSVVAHGGYGRRVMAPHSDVDFTFMLAGNGTQVPTEAAKVISEFLLFFYDLKLKVGQATRSVGDCLRQANEDMMTKTALMEARLICGDGAPFEEFQRRFGPECMKNRTAEFLRQRLDDLAQRHHKFGNTHCVQEPHVKNGCGSLRDYQNLIWVTFARLGTLNPRDLVAKGFMSPLAWRELSAAYNFILRTRNEMHYSERRAGDLLTLRLQGVVATNLGYRHKRILRRIEAFMRDYYTATRDILQRSSEVMDSLNLATQEEDSGKRRGLLSFMIRRRPSGRSEKTDGFIIRNERLFAEDKNIYRQDPARLMRTFLLTQQRHLRMSPQLFQLMQGSFRLVNAGLRYQRDVREVFLEILSHRGEVARVLRQMHRVGLLGRYLPEFGALTCLVQHEFFHRYTADEHTLRTLDMLDQLLEPGSGHELYRRLFQQIQQPEILYLALLMHDTGRAANTRAHDAQSTLLADAVCRRLMIKGERRRLLLFLVDNHLLLYRTATTSNLEDPLVIGEVARIVKSKEYLDALLVMTHADSRGTSEGSWTGYKEASILGLYHSTLAYLDAPADFMRRASAPLEELQQAVQAALSADYQAETAAHFQHMPRSYFNFREAAAIAAHVRQMREFFEQLRQGDGDSGLLPVVRWQDFPAVGYSELTVVGWDRHLLLARLSGALAAQGINILSADFFQRADHLVLDVLRVCNTNFAAITSKSAKARVEQALREALLQSQFDFREAIAALRQRLPDFGEAAGEIPQRIFINNEVSPDHTVAELQVIDRLGLLHEVMVAIGQLDLSVAHARICTDKGMAIDAIYIQGQDGGKLRDPAQLDLLRQRLEQALLAKPLSAAPQDSPSPEA